uniref:SUI1 domain-containing protein n=1 Tax=Aegilops tauschii subsp. strangulata TaxID=200361 RepID=A0A453BD89_AEGTS
LVIPYHVHFFRNFLMQASCLDHCCSFPFQVIQLQGDQRKNVSNFLVQAGIVKKEHIKIHGF